MCTTIDDLKAHSNLPGARANLSLLVSFSETASIQQVENCLAYCTADVANSPDEFVAMCGIVGLCVQKKDEPEQVLGRIKDYASHASWRVREAVAIGIQKIAHDNLLTVIDLLSAWISGTDYERRAVVAALCEPKLLSNQENVKVVLGLLQQITADFEKIDGKLSDAQKVLRKALGYGWSVAVVKSPSVGKATFETLLKSDNKHIRWIMKENLKKNRMKRMDEGWTSGLAQKL